VIKTIRNKKLKKEKSKKKRKVRKEIKPRVDTYDLRIIEPEPDKYTPLWVGHQKINNEFPIYKFKVGKELHIVDEDKCSRKDAWQSMKLHTGSEKEFAEKILKVKKREWLWEYLTLLEANEDQKSFQSLTNHRNL